MDAPAASATPNLFGFGETKCTEHFGVAVARSAGSAVQLCDTDWTGHTGAAHAAVAVGVLCVGEVLLVVVLGEVELPGGDDLGGDLAVAARGQDLLVGVA